MTNSNTKRVPGGQETPQPSGAPVPLPQKEFGNVNDVAILLGITLKEVKNLMRRGVLLRERHYRKIGRVIVFHMASVREVMIPQDAGKHKNKTAYILTKADASSRHFTESIPMVGGYGMKI